MPGRLRPLFLLESLCKSPLHIIQILYFAYSADPGRTTGMVRKENACMLRLDKSLSIGAVMRPLPPSLQVT